MSSKTFESAPPGEEDQPERVQVHLALSSDRTRTVVVEVPSKALLADALADVVGEPDGVLTFWFAPAGNGAAGTGCLIVPTREVEAITLREPTGAELGPWDQ